MTGFLCKGYVKYICHHILCQASTSHSSSLSAQIQMFPLKTHIFFRFMFCVTWKLPNKFPLNFAWLSFNKILHLWNIFHGMTKLNHIQITQRLSTIRRNMTSNTSFRIHWYFKNHYCSELCSRLNVPSFLEN